MEKYNLTQTGQEVQNILDNATPQSELTAETERAQEAERVLGEGVQQNADDIDAIEGKIPSAATSENKLTDKEYVDGQIDAEKARAQVAEGTLQSNIDAEEARATEAEQTLQGNIDAEEARATEAEQSLQGNIDAEATRIDALEEKVPSGASASNKLATEEYVNESVETAIDAEKDRAQEAESTLQDDIDAEEDRAQEAESTLQSYIEEEEERAKAAERQNADDIDALEAVVPVDATTENKLATIADVTNEANARETADNSLSSAIEAILLLIPSAATSLNKLADKDFVNSSISAASATFRGTYNLVSDLRLTVSATRAQIALALNSSVAVKDNNDYVFVQIPTADATPTQIAKTERFKYNGTIWEYEYDLNNSGYTSAQWAAINSGITEALVNKLSDLPMNADLTTALGVLTSSITTINLKIPETASQANKLVDTAAMESYIVQVLNVLTASFNVTSSDGHVTVQISQVDGKITSFALTTLDIASAASLSLVEGRVTTAEGNISTNSADIAILQDAYAALTQSALVIVKPTDTWPVASPATSTIYRVVDRTHTPPQYYSDYMWNGTAMVLMATYNNAIDPRPKKASQNLVTSGGVFDNMGALDVSELNATENPHTLAKYVDLSAALAAIPIDYRKGGMSIKFVQSSDHKYVQYRFMLSEYTAAMFGNPANWQGVEGEPIAGSKNLVDSGGVYNYGAGINELSILDGLSTRNGYYTNTGGFVENDEFTATSNRLTLERNSVYVYRGSMFATVSILFYDKNDNRSYIAVDNISNNPRVLRYQYNEGNSRIIMVEFKVEDEELYALFSAQTTLYPFKLFRKCDYDASVYYENLSNLDFNSLHSSVFNNLTLRKNYGTEATPDYKVLASYLFNSANPIKASLYGADERKAIWENMKDSGFVFTNDEMVKGVFWRGDVGVGNTAVLDTNSSASSLIVPMNEGEKIYVRSYGNSVAPTIMFVDASLTILSILSTGLVNDYFEAPENAAFIIINQYGYTSCLIRWDAPTASYLKTSAVQVSTNMLNILDGLQTQKGYYTADGSFVANNEFTAVTNRVKLAKNATYVYRGAFFAVMAIVFYDNEGNRSHISQDNLNSSPYVVRYETNTAGNRVIMVEFNTGNNELSALFSSQDSTPNNILGGPFIVYQKCVDFTDSKYVNAGLTLPLKLYAIKGLEKSLYVDNITNKNDIAPEHSIGIVKSFGNFDGSRFYFTPNATGNKSIRINLWDSGNKLIVDKSQSIEIVNNTLSSQKRICCIGDSITEGQNMPYYIEQCLDSVLTNDSVRPTFVGTKGGTSGMANKPTKHEGWYGRSYQWLSSDADSPFINPNTNQLDIAYYRTTKLGLSASEYIDVVSLGMGFNGTSTESDANQSFSAMQAIIAAFKADNANTKFIVQLVTYPAKGNVLVPDDEDRVAKKASLLYFKNLCLNTYNNNQDASIVIGDLGLGYDRWYAYPQRTEAPSSYYPEENIKVVTDWVHPTADGAKQMGENIAPVILKMLQL